MATLSPTTVTESGLANSKETQLFFLAEVKSEHCRQDYKNQFLDSIVILSIVPVDFT